MIGASASFALCANVAILAPPAAPPAFFAKIITAASKPTSNTGPTLLKKNEKRPTSQLALLVEEVHRTAALVD